MPREGLLVRTFVELADTQVADFDVIELLTLLAHRCVDVLEVDAAGLMLVGPDGNLRVMASSSEAMRVFELFELQSQEGPCLDCHRSGLSVVNQDLAAANSRWPRFAAEALTAGFHSVHALPLRLRGAVIGALNLFHLQAGQMEHAFSTLRNHARTHNLGLVHVAHHVIDGTLAASALTARPPNHPEQPPTLHTSDRQPVAPRRRPPPPRQSGRHRRSSSGEPAEPVTTSERSPGRFTRLSPASWPPTPSSPAKCRPGPATSSLRPRTARPRPDHLESATPDGSSETRPPPGLTTVGEFRLRLAATVRRQDDGERKQ